MLFEQRLYTLKLGTIEQFWQAQVDRGFSPVQPIMDRLVGYFSTRSGPAEQIVHLYRYDSYDDWVERLHGLYGLPELEPYFKTVRELMVTQENRFLALAPLEQLNPLWGGARDWHPGGPGPRSGRMLPRDSLIEESTLQLVPGALPQLWKAYAAIDLSPESLACQHLFGCFTTLVGRFHQVIHYRHYPSFEARQAHRQALGRDRGWTTLLRAMRPAVLGHEIKLLSPAETAELSPLFSA